MKLGIATDYTQVTSKAITESWGALFRFKLRFEYRNYASLFICALVFSI